MLKVNDLVPDFNAKAFHNNEIKEIKLSDFIGKWIIMFFYPADFTFVCPTEIGEIADNYDKLKEMNVEVLSISTDTEFAHKAWHDNSDTIKKVKFPMLADPTGRISRVFGTYIMGDGVSLRGTFIINPDGVLKAYEIHDNSIGRSTEELIRKIHAAQFVREHDGEVCPASWKPGKETLKPGLELVGKI